MKTRAQRVTFRAILAVGTVLGILLGLSFQSPGPIERPLETFVICVVVSLVVSLIIAGLVVWVMKGFSDPPKKEDSDAENGG